MTKAGTKVQHVASLHEKAVQAVAKGEVALTPRRTRKAPQNGSEVVQPTYQSPVVDARVWAAAKRLLDGPHGYTRWEIPEENVVIVR